MPKMCLISVGVQVAFPSRSREDVHVISNKNFWRTLLYRKSISLLGYSPNFLLFTGKRALCVSQNICNKGLSESKIELEYTKILDPIRYIFFGELYGIEKKATKGFFLKRSSFCGEACTLRVADPDRSKIRWKSK